VLDLHYFRSRKDPSLHAFTDETSGKKLPQPEGPWRFVRTVTANDGWTRHGDHSSVMAGVRINGFALVESDSELTFERSWVETAA
jgi:hypothetical protein